MCKTLSENYKALLKIPSVSEDEEQQELLNTDGISGSWYSFGRQFGST